MRQSYPGEGGVMAVPASGGAASLAAGTITRLYDVARAPDGSLYAIEGNTQVVRFDPSAAWQRTVLANIADVSPAPGTTSPLFRGIAVDAAGRVFVTASGPAYVYEVTPDLASPAAASLRIVGSHADLGNPWTIAFDLDGSLLVANNGGPARIFRLDPNATDQTATLVASGGLVNQFETATGIFVVPAPVVNTPEPASLALVGVGALAAFSGARRR